MNEDESLNEVWSRVLAKEENTTSVYLYASARERIEKTSKEYNSELLKAKEIVDEHIEHMGNVIGEYGLSPNPSSSCSEEGRFLFPNAPNTPKSAKDTKKSIPHPWKRKHIRKIIITE